MNRTDWTEQLRKRMERQEEPVDDSLWAGIEQALDSPSVGRRPAHGLSLRRWIAAAAVLLGLVVGSVYWLSRHGEQAVARLERPKAPMERKARALRELLHDEPESPLSKAVARLSSPVVPENTDMLGCVEPAEVTDTTADYVARNVPKGSASTAESPSKQPETIDKPARGATVLPSSDPLSPTAATHRRSNRGQSVELRLYAGNGLMDYRRSNRVTMSDEMRNQYLLSRASVKPMARSASVEDNHPIYLVGYGEQTRHALPLSVGLTVNVPLADNWSLTTGMVYTQLNATFTRQIRRHAIESRQRLHDIGLPLGLNYRFVHGRRLSLYATGGAQIDFNVHARMETEGTRQPMRKDRPQLSATAGVGAVYHLLPVVGLYVEPSMRYAFDNGSSVQTYFKEKPFSPSLQMGVRVEIK